MSEKPDEESGFPLLRVWRYRDNRGGFTGPGRRNGAFPRRTVVHGVETIDRCSPADPNPRTGQQCRGRGFAQQEALADPESTASGETHSPEVAGRDSSPR
jgi:hypothetical protein